MKTLITFIALFTILFSLNLLAKKDVSLKSFNKEMQKNMNEVIQDNPQMYETKPIRMNRAPASVSPVETTQKLDEVEEQADSPKDW
jgi:hypothetical protein